MIENYEHFVHWDQHEAIEADLFSPCTSDTSLTEYTGPGGFVTVGASMRGPHLSSDFLGRWTTIALPDQREAPQDPSVFLF